MITDGSFLPETDWCYLLQEIHNRQVIPIVGPELVTVHDPETNSELSLYSRLAPQLASALGLPVSNAGSSSLNRVACDCLLSGKPRKPIYVAICDLLDKLDRLNSPPLGCALQSKSFLSPTDCVTRNILAMDCMIQNSETWR